MSSPHPQHPRKATQQAPKADPPRRLPLIAAGLVLVVALVAALVVALSGQNRPFTPEVVGAPAIRVDQSLIDYGVVKNNTMIETVVRVRNVGDQALYLLGDPHVEVREGCCPPQARVSTKTLFPGDEALVQLSFSMHEGMDGPHDFRLHIRSTDPAQPESEITILSDWVA